MPTDDAWAVRERPLVEVARTLLERNRENYEQLVARATTPGTRADAAIAWGQMAARQAWLAHGGLLADRRLEALLVQNAIPSRSSARRRIGDIRRVLHVMTVAYDVGGHTRLCWRWMQMDSQREHGVALTSQRSLPIPSVLQAAATAGVRDLAPDSAPLRVRAARLNELAANFDLVVVHAHPDDVVPALALVDSPVPVVLMNHADHVFWVGVVASSVVAHIRPNGAVISARRRGIAPSRCVSLPIPLPTAPTAPTRAEARKALGITSPRDKVLVTVASGYKFTPVEEFDYLQALVPLVSSRTDVRLLVAGPGPDGAWRRAAEATGGRLQALGTVADPVPLYVAADLYVDSFPFGSATSMLEAAQLATPSVVVALPGDGAHFVSFDDPAFADDTRRLVRSDVQLRDTIAALLDDDGTRTRLGAAASERVNDMHCGARWYEALEAVYVAAREFDRANPNERLPSPAGPINDHDALLALVHERGGHSMPMGTLLRQQLQYLPVRERVAHWIQLRRAYAVPVDALISGRLRRTASRLWTHFDVPALLSRLQRLRPARSSSARGVAGR